MARIEFSEEESQHMVDRLQKYFSEELGQELGGFDARFLLDFISTHLGACYYNRGLMDAQAILLSRLDNITEAIAEIELPVPIESGP